MPDVIYIHRYVYKRRNIADRTKWNDDTLRTSECWRTIMSSHTTDSFRLATTGKRRKGSVTSIAVTRREIWTIWIMMTSEWKENWPVDAMNVIPSMVIAHRAVKSSFFQRARALMMFIPRWGQRVTTKAERHWSFTAGIMLSSRPLSSIRRQRRPRLHARRSI